MCKHSFLQHIVKPIFAAGMKIIWGQVAEGWVIATNEMWNHPLGVAKAIKKDFSGAIPPIHPPGPPLNRERGTFDALLIRISKKRQVLYGFRNCICRYSKSMFPNEF